MDLRIPLLAIAMVWATACSRDVANGLPDTDGITAEIRHAGGSGADAQLVARATSRFARHPAMLRVAAWDKAAAHCGEASFVPLGLATAITDESQEREAYEQVFKCSHERLPNDERMTAEAIQEGRWAAPVQGTQIREGWAGYGYPGSRPFVAFTQMLGAHVVAAYADCGERAFVVERIESRTQSAGPRPVDPMSRARIQGSRLQYRCLDATPTQGPVAPPAA